LTTVKAKFIRAIYSFRNSTVIIYQIKFTKSDEGLIPFIAFVIIQPLRV
jgi:hypothetical protein